MTAVAVFVTAALSAIAAAETPPQTYKGLEIKVTSLERAMNVSLQDCPAGSNIVRGVIRPTEENEFATVRIEVKLRPSFEPVSIERPVLRDDAAKEYKTAQAFGDFAGKDSFSCDFSFRVPKGTKLKGFAIEEASFDLSAIDR